MKRSPQLLSQILDALVIDPHWASAARKVGLDVKTVFRYVERSKAGDPKFLITWCDVEAQFATHCASAMKMSVALIESMARKNASGFDEVVVYEGAVQYQVDSTLLVNGEPDKELIEMLGLKDHYLRDENGACIPLTVRRKPSDALVTLMLRSYMPKTYADRAQLDVNVGGVLRLQRPDERAAPKVIDQPAGDYVLEDDDAEQAVKPRCQLALGRPAKDSAELDKWAADGEFEPRPVTFVKEDGERVVRIAAPDPLLGEGVMSPLKADLLRRAAQAPKHPHPTHPVAVGRPSDEAPAPKQAKTAYRSDDERRGTGSGKPLPGGHKVV